MSARFRWTLTTIAALGAGIRLFRLDHFSYGLDEVLQANWLNGSWSFFWKSIRFDAVHPPLDYLLGRFVEVLHPTDAVRKVPAVAWGVGAVLALGVLVGIRASPAAGLTAATLLAFAPFHVRYSQELRPYSLSLLLLTLSLLALDWLLAAPNWWRFVVLFLSCLATAYTLYLAAVVLGIAGAGLAVEDAFAADSNRRRNARRFLIVSPLFLAALWLAYLPWWPVVLEAARRPPAVPALPLTLHRAAQTLSFFAFAPIDGYPLTWPGGLFAAAALAGLWMSLRSRGTRFLAFWVVGGFAAVEILGQIHPHFFGNRSFLPPGIAILALAALPLAALLSRPVTRLVGAAVLAAILVLDANALRVYFRQGRADWRTLADFLRREAAPTEHVFTENQYSQLCVAFYLVGPTWLSGAIEGSRTHRDLPNLEGEIVRLNWAWKPGTRAWLVLAGQPQHPELRTWAAQFPVFPFPAAEGAILHRLDPEVRDRALGLPR